MKSYSWLNRIEHPLAGQIYHFTDMTSGTSAKTPFIIWTWITPRILHHSACHIERHILDICFRSFLLEWALVTFRRSMVSWKIYLYKYLNTEYSEMNSEIPIEHDHPSRADKNLAIKIRVPNLSVHNPSSLRKSSLSWSGESNLVMWFASFLPGTHYQYHHQRISRPKDSVNFSTPMPFMNHAWLMLHTHTTVHVRWKYHLDDPMSSVFGNHIGMLMRKPWEVMHLVKLWHFCQPVNPLR